MRWSDSRGNTLTGAIDNILVRNNRLIVLYYKTRGFELKDDTHTHYQSQIDIYNLLLEKSGYATEKYGFLPFYVPDKVEKDGSVIFKTTLKKMRVDKRNALRLFNRAIRLLEGRCPKKGCEWCERVG